MYSQRRSPKENMVKMFAATTSNLLKSLLVFGTFVFTKTAPRDSNIRFWAISEWAKQKPTNYKDNSVSLSTDLKFTSRQKRLIRRYPGILYGIADGVKMAIDACQSEFKYERWNCPIVDKTFKGTGFGEVLNSGYPEAGLIQALVSAGIAHKVARVCTDRTITACSCAHSPPSLASKEKLKARWTGCMPNINFGMHVSKVFMEGGYNIKRSRRQGNKNWNLKMMKHNFKAGRLHVQYGQNKTCSCGYMLTCALKTCTMQLDPFKEIVRKLKTQYFNAKSLHSKVNTTTTKGTKRRRQKHNQDDIVYHKKPPSYCQSVPHLQFKANYTRQCNGTQSDSSSSCTNLCCGRDYRTEYIVTNVKCKCRFVWCCYVKCQTCRKEVKRYYCLPPTNDPRFGISVG
uniref:Protein Wnt n=1 Tax=Terebratalia transversa TaxID=34513 RepID=A0AAU7EC95_TERTR